LYFNADLRVWHVLDRSVEAELEHIEKAEKAVQKQSALPREIQHRLEAIRKQKNNKVCWRLL
jgi:hypothetical protein